MKNEIISSYSLEELTTVFSDCIKKELQNFTPPQIQEEELITENEAKEILKVSKVTLKSWRDKNLIKGYKIGTRIRYKKTELLNSILTVKKFGRVVK